MQLRLVNCHNLTSAWKDEQLLRFSSCRIAGELTPLWISHHVKFLSKVPEIVVGHKSHELPMLFIVGSAKVEFKI
jgi:hypothetical protein